MTLRNNKGMFAIMLPPEMEAVLRERVRANGDDMGKFAARLLLAAFRGRRADELLAPFRRQVEQSGATDAELDALCDTLRDEVWQDRQAMSA